MHAVVVTVNTPQDPGEQEVARKGLREEVVPRVKAMPGFVKGYWTAPLDGRGMSMTLWGDESAAMAAAAAVRESRRPPGVTLASVETREVIEEA